MPLGKPTAQRLAWQTWKQYNFKGFLGILQAPLTTALKGPGDKVDEAHTVSTQRSRTPPIAKGPFPFSKMQVTLTGWSPAGPLMATPASLRSWALRSWEKLGNTQCPISLFSWLSFRATVKEFGQKHQEFPLERKPSQEQG